MEWLERGSLRLCADNAAIEAELHQRGWWSAFAARQDEARRVRRGPAYCWAVLLISEAELHAIIGVSGHPRDEDNGYFWCYVAAPDASNTEYLQNLLARVFGLEPELAVLDQHDVGSLN